MQRLGAPALATLRADSGGLADWRDLVRRQPAQGQQILRLLPSGRLLLTPGQDAEGRFYAFAAEATLGRLVAGTLGRVLNEW